MADIPVCAAGRNACPTLAAKLHSTRATMGISEMDAAMAKASRIAVLTEEKGAGGDGDGKDAEKGANRFAEVVGREVGFSMDAAGEREGFAERVRSAAETAVAPAGDGGRVVG